MQEKIKKLIRFFSVETKSELFLIWAQSKPMPGEYTKVERLLETIKEWDKWKENNEADFNNFKKLQEIRRYGNNS